MTTLLTYTRLASRAVFVECLCHLFSQLVFLEHGAHGKRSGRYLLFVEVFLQEWTESISGLE